MNGHNPYQSPAVSVAPAAPAERDIPETISAPIRHGWITACVSGALTLLATLAAVVSQSRSENAVFSGWNMIDVALIAALAFGIHKRSRTAATIMFLYFALSKILVVMTTGQPTGLVFGLVFLFFYFRAMTATYRYHRFLRNWRQNPPAPRASLADNPLFKPHPGPAENP
ncbi:hypothetical protein [Stenotrophomonas sp. SY1]|uniref:hypothetical protein n=1 Tax=Stenotrophomonas sp. SY1 TaxID=477235 RepID=UPI001E2E724C|nr:hypothetical protein [Stenotrophomonas sp. SY1]MCD9087511.1 hypothetical protein [Stenotrophomonas sp. SY1]